MALLDSLQSLSLSTLLYSTTFIASLALAYFVFSSRASFPAKAPKVVGENLPILGALRFWTARWDFFREAGARSPSGNFSFHFGQHRVVGFTGDKSRAVFFENRTLAFSEGYAILFGGSPKVKRDNSIVGETLTETSEFPGYFANRLTRMLKKENFVKGLPYLISDVRSNLDVLAASPSGMTDPFNSIYNIVFQLTMRTVACNDIANDPKLLARVLKLYETIEQSTTAATIMFPWLPTPAKARRTWGGAQLYRIFKRIIDERKKTGAKCDDPLQFLLDQGDDVLRVITFVLGALFAGQLNSGINAAWVLVYLATSSEWLSRVRAEVEAVAAKYSPNSTAPLPERLAALPIEAWETEFPILDMCLKDSIRLSMVGTAFRLNTSGADIKVGDEVIPPDALVAYPTGDIHQNPDIYPDPTRWDPGRYAPERAEDKKRQYAWMGWGLARHPCLGMRFAKLESNIITTFFVAYFDFELVGRDGGLMKEPPKVDLNGFQASKPKKNVFLKYRLREKVML
ncbi:hypothetical protein LTR66_008926 [Elasticomyces elasticus]|nr:hypothetical protein LTR66_008926 [Elasticomyces elasticus]